MGRARSLLDAQEPRRRRSPLHGGAVARAAGGRERPLRGVRALAARPASAGQDAGLQPRGRAGTRRLPDRRRGHEELSSLPHERAHELPAHAGRGMALQRRQDRDRPDVLRALHVRRRWWAARARHLPPGHARLLRRGRSRPRAAVLQPGAQPLPGARRGGPRAPVPLRVRGAARAGHAHRRADRRQPHAALARRAQRRRARRAVARSPRDHRRLLLLGGRRLLQRGLRALV